MPQLTALGLRLEAGNSKRAAYRHWLIQLRIAHQRTVGVLNLLVDSPESQSRISQM
jgi:hypothetical protein